MTEEYYTAVKEFNVTWSELCAMGTNSLHWSFAEPALKAKLLEDYRQSLARFEQRFGGGNWADSLKTVHPVAYGYARRRWNIFF